MQTSTKTPVSVELIKFFNEKIANSEIYLPIDAVMEMGEIGPEAIPYLKDPTKSETLIAYAGDKWIVSTRFVRECFEDPVLTRIYFYPHN